MKFLRGFKLIKNKIYTFVLWFLNLSLYWKVGFFIGSCFFINLFIALHFYYLFNHAIELNKDIPYQYEILTERALELIQNKNISLKTKRSLENVLMELENAAKDYPQIKLHIEKIKDNFNNFNTLKAELTQLNSFFNSKRLEVERKLHTYKSLSKYFRFLLILTMVAFLFWGTWAFYYMVKKPLDRILESLEYFTKEEEDKEYSFSEICLLDYPSKDEIGKIIKTLNNILSEYEMLRVFKRTIEDDETVELVYERLGYCLQYNLGINHFILYQVSNSQNTMEPMYISDPNITYSSEIIVDANKCRAKRTGEVVNSLIFPEICKIFPFKDTHEHCCIPMNYGGKCIGVVAIYFPKEDIWKDSEDIKEGIRKAKLFIKEAIPVIEAKRYAEALKEQTFRDALTGLYNRHFLEATLENLTAQILRRESVLGILMCDLDYFKSVNDKYGHDAGDLILKETARLLSSNVRKSDMVIRFGGEEFLILLVDVKEGESIKVAEKLRHVIETYEFKIPQGVVKRTISIGVSEFPVDTQAIWEAIKFADVALYKAKEAGRNKVVRFRREFWTEENY